MNFATVIRREITTENSLCGRRGLAELAHRFRDHLSALAPDAVFATRFLIHALRALLHEVVGPGVDAVLRYRRPTGADRRGHLDFPQPGLALGQFGLCVTRQG